MQKKLIITTRSVFFVQKLFCNRRNFSLTTVFAGRRGREVTVSGQKRSVTSADIVEIGQASVKNAIAFNFII